MLESMLVAVCGAQLCHVLFLEVDAIVTAIAPITMIAAQMFHLLLATNTVVSKQESQIYAQYIHNQ